MSTSAFLLLRTTLAVHLATDPALADVPIYEGRTRPIATHEVRAINIRVLDSDPTQAVLEATDWHTVLQIECSARETVERDADSAADELLDVVHRRLHSFAPEGLGMIGPDGEDASVAWDHDADDTNYTCISLRHVIVHRTPAGSLQPWN